MKILWILLDIYFFICVYGGIRSGASPGDTLRIITIISLLSILNYNVFSGKSKQ